MSISNCLAMISYINKKAEVQKIPFRRGNNNIAGQLRIYLWISSQQQVAHTYMVCFA